MPTRYVFVVDRIKDMIITGGENVYSIEVENVISKHPAIATCAVIGLPDDKWGERVHAVVVLQAGAALELEQLQELARGHIAGYKIPRSLSFVDALPLSAAGKVLKRELRSQLAGSASALDQRQPRLTPTRFACHDLRVLSANRAFALPIPDEA